MVLDLPPDNLAQAPVVMVADAGQAKKPIATMRTVGICEPMENLPNDPVFNRETIDFQGAAVNYLFKYEKINLAKHGAKITLFQPPAHGQLSEIGNGAASYKPTPGFYGRDKIVALVELGGYRVKVVYFIKVVNQGVMLDDDASIKKYCGSKGRMWKILSSTLTFDNTNLQALLDAASINSSVPVMLSDLPGSAIGQTTGTSITLAPSAATGSWYIDYTPYLNDDYRGPTHHSTGPARKAAQAGEFKR